MRTQDIYRKKRRKSGRVYYEPIGSLYEESVLPEGIWLVRKNSISRIDGYLYDMYNLSETKPAEITISDVASLDVTVSNILNHPDMRKVIRSGGTVYEYVAKAISILKDMNNGNS